MMLKWPAILVALTALSAAMPAAATTTTVNANAQGWCHENYGCQYYDSGLLLSNTFAGRANDENYRNFFRFNLPAGVYSSATISIFNDGRNYTGAPDNIYTLRPGTAISYAGLGSGTALGSVRYGDADTGVSHYETITLNGSALALLNAAAGGSFLFGGSMSGDLSVSDAQLFGYITDTSATPAYLTLTTAVAGVPEPATWGLMILGFGAIGGAMRSRRRVAAGRDHLSSAIGR